MKVKSMTDQNKEYEVIKRRDGTYYCSCLSFKYGTKECKHIKNVKKLDELRQDRRVILDNLVEIYNGFLLDVLDYNEYEILITEEHKNLKRINKRIELLKNNIIQEG